MGTESVGRWFGVLSMLSASPEFRYIGWSGKTRAIWLTATIDSKHAGLALTA
jgi:hypothetical protein